MRSPLTAMKSSPREPQLEKAHMQLRRPSIAKNKIINLFKKVRTEKTPFTKKKIIINYKIKYL